MADRPLPARILQSGNVFSDGYMGSITCTECGKSFEWASDLAGRDKRCTCGTTINFPKEPPDDEMGYELAPEATKPVRRATDVNDGAVGPPRIALAYRTAKRETAAPLDTEAIKNLHMPMWLLGGGTLIQIAAAILTQNHGLAAALTTVAFQLIFGTAFMLVGILLAAKFRGISFGAFWIAVFKLAAISVAPGAVVAIFSPLLNHIPFGGLIGLAAEFVLYFTLLGVLFDLDESDTWYCVCVIFLVHLAIYFLLIGAAAKWG